MKKSVRMVLYFLSLITLSAVVFLVVFSEKRTQDTSLVQKDTQENVISENSTEKQENKVLEEVASEVQETETETQPESEAVSAETTLLFAGDVLISSRIQNYYNAEGVVRIVSEELLQEMKNADILMLNNEFPFSNRGTPMEDKQFTFQCEPQYVSVLKELGVDIVSLANNHTLDYGREALSDTFETLEEAGILYAGAGETRERAEQVQIVEVNGKKFGFIAASRVIPVTDWDVRNRTPGMFTTYDDTRLTEVVTEAEKECDFVTVFLHWGIEYEEYPQEYQRTIAKNCFQAGADAVIGAHTHCLQGIEFMDGKPVYYSLGNYIFADSVDKSAAVKITIAEDNTVTYELLPVCTINGTTQIMKEDAKEALFQYMEDISVNVSIDAKGVVSNEK